MPSQGSGTPKSAADGAQPHLSRHSEADFEGGTSDLRAGPRHEPDAALAAPDCLDGSESAVADVPQPPRGFDAARVEKVIYELLVAIGEDPQREGLRETPQRVARSYAEVFAGLQQDPAQVLTTFFDAGHEELVLVRDIELYSTCEHHLVPFHGVAHVGYIPAADGRITGLSKVARLVDVYAKRPQVQERLTTQIADAMVEHLRPRGVIVVIDCEHLCMSMRGIRKPGARTVTSAVRGVLRRQATRAEAMSLIMR